MNNEITHIVKSGETLYSIANKYNTTVKQLVALNNLHNTVLKVGQIIKIRTKLDIDFPNQLTYEEFINTNLGLGVLKIQTLIGNTMFPIKDVLIEVFKIFNGEEKIFFNGKTEESGLIDNIQLPSRKKRTDYLNSATIYQIRASHPDFKTVIIDQVFIYDEIKSIQKIEMLPSSYILEKEKANDR